MILSSKSILSKVIPFILGMTLLFSCNHLKDENKIQKEITYFDDIEIINSFNHQVSNSLELDTILIKPELGVGKGFIQMANDELLFLDMLRTEVRPILPNYQLGRPYLTQGDGPNQVPNFQSFYSLGKEHLFISGWTYFIYDSNWKMKQKGAFQFYTNDQLNEIMNNPRADMAAVYEFKYYEQEPILTKDQLLVKIESSNPKFNFVMHRDYYQHARIAAMVNLNTGKIVEMLGRKPPKYLEYNFIPHHDHHYWDKTEAGQVFVSYEPDSLIYICDEKLKPIKAFGTSGIQMNTDYYEVNTVLDYDSYWYPSYTRKGYYKHIHVLENGKWVLRTYNQGTSDPLAKGYGDNPKRLQVYKDYKLILDAPVPSFFKVIGERDGYIYADGSAENPENEEIIIYRFRLNELSS